MFTALITLFSFSFSWISFSVFILVALLIGMAKTGVHGAGMAAVPLLATIFGGQLSSGIMLPMLCLADIAGVWYYHRHAAWGYLKRLIPWAITGTVIGTFAGQHIDDKTFRILMAVIILGSIAIMVLLERYRQAIPDNPVFASATGVTGGFTSMVGNLAGSVMAVYFLSMRLPKNSYIGTTAWFFMVMNWIKIPLHVWSWHTITLQTVWLDLIMLPAILGGAYLGIVLVRLLPERIYRWFIIGMTMLAAVLMLV